MFKQSNILTVKELLLDRTKYTVSKEYNFLMFFYLIHVKKIEKILELKDFTYKKLIERDYKKEYNSRIHQMNTNNLKDNKIQQLAKIQNLKEEIKR